MSHKQNSSLNSNDSNESSLLAELAGEATSKLRAIQSDTEDRDARTQRLHSSLNRIFQFFHSFSGYVNNIAPVIPRPYNLDNNSAYTALKWQNAFTDSRKQDFSEVATFDYVSFSVRLLSPEPIMVTRRWNQFETLKNELNVFGLRSLDDLDKLLRNKSQLETFSTRLAPDFFVKILFKGNYDDGMIDVKCNNFDGFGVAMFKLNPENVTKELLDETGRFLIGRTDDLPLPLKLARCIPKQFV